MSSRENPPEIIREADLYSLTRRFVEMRFPALLSRRARSGIPIPFCNEVAETAGDPGGQWSRPDVAVLVISYGEYVPYWRADLHTIEVKTAGTVDVISAHEARAHGRYGHYCWLAFQAVGRAASQTARYKEVVDSAVGLGVGVLTCQCADDPDDWGAIEWPERTNTDNAVADSFIRQRFDERTKTAIRSFLASRGWPTDAER